MNIIREACVETKEQLDNAFKHHAEQIELCSRLDVGGFTPDYELTKYALSKSDHILIMIRNRPDYVTNCFNTWRLKRIIKKYVNTNIQGFVFGFLKNGKIDEKTIKSLLKVIANKETVFHMAFDQLTDWKEGIDTLVRLGITRILTKGGSDIAINNIEQLKAYKEYANNRIQLIIGGSVTDENYQTIAKATGINRFHGRKLAFNA